MPSAINNNMKRFIQNDISEILKKNNKAKIDYGKVNRRLDAEVRSSKTKLENLIKKGKHIMPKKSVPNKALKPLNKMTGAKAAKVSGVAKTSLLGLGAVAGAAYLGGKAIVEARKGVEKALDEQNYYSAKNFENAKKLQTHLQEKKKKGLSKKLLKSL